jgi:DNA-binding MarR family transcriptional regulator
MARLAETEAYQIVWLTRRLFRAMAHKSDETLRDLGITSADRAVMEFLHPDRHLAVPELAERYRVSRQHVQVTVNSLLEKGLATAIENPRHKRSPLIGLSDQGRALFETVLSRDAQTLREIFSGISERDVTTTHRTLRVLFQRLS